MQLQLQSGPLPHRPTRRNTHAQTRDSGDSFHPLRPLHPLRPPGRSAQSQIYNRRAYVALARMCKRVLSKLPSDFDDAIKANGSQPQRRDAQLQDSTHIVTIPQLLIDQRGSSSPPRHMPARPSCGDAFSPGLAQRVRLVEPNERRSC